MSSTLTNKTASFALRAAGKWLRVEVCGRDHEAETAFERNRLHVRIRASADGISADFMSFLWAHELANLRNSLETFARTLHSEGVSFVPYERTVLLSIMHSGRGQIDVEVTLEPTQEKPDQMQTSMRLGLCIDQTELSDLTTQLSALLRAFPVEPM